MDRTWFRKMLQPTNLIIAGVVGIIALAIVFNPWITGGILGIILAIKDV